MDAQKKPKEVSVMVGLFEVIQIKCPYCSNIVTIDKEKIPKAKEKNDFNSKCLKCKQSFLIRFFHRLSVRKDIRFDGLFFCDDAKYNISFHNLSLGGARFNLSRLPRSPINIGDKGFVEFNLDNQRESEIKTSGTIRYVSDKVVGFEFDELDAFHKKELGFYMMP